MKFSIVHPTARVKPYPSFPTGWLGSCWQFHDCCVNPWEVEYIVVVHVSRIAEFWQNVAQFKTRIPAWGRFQVVVNDGRDCLVDQCNAGLLAATGEIIIGTMDDLHAPKNWDTKIAGMIPDTSQPVVLQVGETQNGALFIPQVQTRALARLVGLHPVEYVSMFADNEWTSQAKRFGVVFQALGMGFVHHHPIFGRSKSDAVYELENADSAYKIGREVFERRRAAGFPVAPYPGSAAPVARPSKLLAICTPGETFRADWVAARLTLETRLSEAGYTLAPFFAYSSNVYKTRISMARALEALAAVERPDFVLWIDDDNIVLPEQALQLLRWLETHERADGIVGWCWIKRGNEWMLSVGRFEESGGRWAPATLLDIFHGSNEAEQRGPKQVTMSGFPCFLMRYSALEKVGPKAFAPLLNDAAEEGFLGEDGGFCIHAMNAGLKFYVDPTVKVQHLKTQGLEPDTATLSAAISSAGPVEEWRASINGKVLEAPEAYEVTQ